jgi:UPF0755 protein
MRSLKITVVLLALIVLALGALGFVAYDAPANRINSVTVMIDGGTPTRTIVRQLQQQHLLPADWRLVPPMLFYGDHRALKAGEYVFEETLSPRAVLQKMQRGEVVVHKLTIPEGWNRRQIQALLMAEETLTGAWPEGVKEGDIFPSTYHFSRGETRAAVVARMQAEMQETLAELWPQRSSTSVVKTPEEALTLASIVEKETGVKHERPQVAAVFSNRLRLGMPLQADPTVAYGMEQQQNAPLLAPITGDDTRRDTPWNSYTRGGLPPTPIASPGRAAIAAVLNPPNLPYVYFVATGDGGHYFSTSLAEHNRNVVKYRHALRKQ